MRREAEGSADMRVAFFGKLGDAIGREIEVERPAGGCTIAKLRAVLTDLYPHARDDLSSCAARACVGDTFVGEQHEVPEHAVVEFFPPLSGG